MNLRAIWLAQRLVADKREPTPGERGALMLYSGFGSTDVRRRHGRRRPTRGAAPAAAGLIGLDPRRSNRCAGAC